MTEDKILVQRTEYGTFQWRQWTENTKYLYSCLKGVFWWWSLHIYLHCFSCRPHWFWVWQCFKKVKWIILVGTDHWKIRVFCLFSTAALSCSLFIIIICWWDRNKQKKSCDNRKCGFQNAQNGCMNIYRRSNHHIVEGGWLAFS